MNKNKTKVFVYKFNNHSDRLMIDLKCKWSLIKVGNEKNRFQLRNVHLNEYLYVNHQNSKYDLRQIEQVYTTAKSKALARPNKNTQFNWYIYCVY